MSKIEDEMADATEITLKRGEDRQDYLQRMVKGIAKLSDPDWEALSKEAKNWFNKCADIDNTNDAAVAKNPNAKLDDFPEPSEFDVKEEAPVRRGRAAAEPEPEKEKQMVVGSEVTVKTKRGREHKGRVLVIEEDYISLETAGGEQEVSTASIVETIVHSSPDAGGKAADPGAADEPDDGDFMKVGAVVTVTNVRGRVATGPIVEIDDEIIVVKTADEGDVEFQRGRVQDVKLAGGAVDKKATEPAKDSVQRRGAGKSADDKKPEDTGAGKDAKVTKSENGGESVGSIVKGLIADDLNITKEALLKKLDKAGIVYKAATINIQYADAMKFVAILREKKLLPK